MSYSLHCPTLIIELQHIYQRRTQSTFINVQAGPGYFILYPDVYLSHISN